MPTYNWWSLKHLNIKTKIKNRSLCWYILCGITLLWFELSKVNTSIFTCFVGTFSISLFSPKSQFWKTKIMWCIIFQDVDECAIMPEACRNGRCVNTMGSYRCICNTGYKADTIGTNCVDIDECGLETRPCQYTCHNLPGSYKCSCIAGYVLNPDKRTCRDLDECATLRHNCPHTCINTPGSYKCTCPTGYKQQGSTCQGKLATSLVRYPFNIIKSH